MLIQEMQIKMKDGRTAIFRSPREDDALALLDFLKISALSISDRLTDMILKRWCVY